MADDAAGAVRRTPRPAPEPEMIYGTSRTDPIGTVREHDDGTTAVKVSMGDDSTKGQHVWCWMSCKLEVRWLHHYDVAEWAVLAAPEKRPVVLLRAEDCACRYGDDCPHGPEPVDALEQLTAERDEAVALCANLQPTLLDRLAELADASGKLRSAEWLRTCARLPVEEWPPAPAYKGPMVPAAELDERQARINAVPNILRQHYLAWIECDHDRQMDNPQCACSKVDLGWHPTVGDAVNAWIEHVRAALQGDQPTKPVRVPCSERCGMHYTGSLPVPAGYDHRHNAPPRMTPCPGRFADQPTGEANRG